MSHWELLHASIHVVHGMRKNINQKYFTGVKELVSFGASMCNNESPVIVQRCLAQSTTSSRVSGCLTNDS